MGPNLFTGGLPGCIESPDTEFEMSSFQFAIDRFLGIRYGIAELVSTTNP